MPVPASCSGPGPVTVSGAENVPLTSLPDVVVSFSAPLGRALDLICRAGLQAGLAGGASRLANAAGPVESSTLTG